LRPIAGRLDRDYSPLQGIGADRWTGRVGVVLTEIPAGHNELGMVRVDREEWRAESVDASRLSAGTTIEVVKVEGTRVVVRPRAQEEES
jgi:membrane-bound ClpP family serine protease